MHLQLPQNPVYLGREIAGKYSEPDASGIKVLAITGRQVPLSPTQPFFKLTGCWATSACFLAN